MEWVLVIFIHIGYGEALTTVSGFKSKESCEKAGKDSQTLTDSVTLFKMDEYVCLEKK